VRVFLSSNPKLSQPFDVAGPGSVLGLSESVSGREYKVTARAADPIRAAYIEPEKLMHFLGTAISACRLCNSSAKTFLCRTRNSAVSGELLSAAEENP
jgi:hypothetical protein